MAVTWRLCGSHTATTAYLELSQLLHLGGELFLGLVATESFLQLGVGAVLRLLPLGLRQFGLDFAALRLLVVDLRCVRT